MTLGLRHAIVRRGGRALLDSVDFIARAGRFTALCGPNGAGKTTALNALSGATALDAGAATLDDAPVSAFSANALARRRAVLAQSAALAFPFRVHEVVAMGRSPHEGRSSRSRDAVIIRDAMDQADIGHLAERNYLTLSGGERQRTHLARALAQVWEPPEDGSTRWLMLDEPVSALDLKHQLAVMRLLRRLAEAGWGVLAVLHDLRMVRAHAHDAALLADGRVAAAGPADAVLTPLRIQTVFGLDEPYPA